VLVLVVSQMLVEDLVLGILAEELPTILVVEVAVIVLIGRLTLCLLCHLHLLHLVRRVLALMTMMSGTRLLLDLSGCHFHCRLVLQVVSIYT
jgi:hypothetical protein